MPRLDSDCLRLVYHHLPLRSFARCLATCRGWNLHDEASDPLWLAVAHAHAKRQGRHPPDEWLQLHPGWSHFRCADAVGDELRLRSATAGARLRPRAMPPPDGLRRRARQADERCRRRSVEKDKRRALEWRAVAPTWEVIQGSGGKSRSDPWVRAAAGGGAGGAREARGAGGGRGAGGARVARGAGRANGAGGAEGPQDGKALRTATREEVRQQAADEEYAGVGSRMRRDVVSSSPLAPLAPPLWPPLSPLQAAVPPFAAPSPSLSHSTRARRRRARTSLTHVVPSPGTVMYGRPWVWPPPCPLPPPSKSTRSF